MRRVFEVLFMLKIRGVLDDLALAMDGLQCPGEPYTISRLICRGRQAKGYLKCPGCANRDAAAEVIQVQSPPEAMAILATPPSRVAARAWPPVPAAAFRMPLPAAGDATGLLALARRLYDYF